LHRGEQQHHKQQQFAADIQSFHHAVPSVARYRYLGVSGGSRLAVF
jgi:hypothetical protein